MLQLSAEEPAGEARDRWRAPAWSWLVGSLLIVITPIVVAAFRAVASGYRPVGDDGLLLVRIRDVGTSHTPLLGSWTSASLSGKVNFNNPGPIYFDLVASAVKVLGPWAGLVIGAMLVNAAAAVVSVVVAERVAGRTGLIAATATVAALEWTLGSAVLIDVWQPNALVLPAFAYVVCLWALASGWRWALPFVVGLASLLIQTHIGYTYLVALSLVGVVALCVWQERTGGRRTGTSWRRPLLLSVVVVAVVLDRVGDRAADLRRPGQPQPDLVGVTWESDPSLGPALAVRLTAQVLARPPFWLRSSYADAIPLTWGSTSVDVVGTPKATVACLVLVGALVTVGIVHHRRRDRVTAHDVPRSCVAGGRRRRVVERHAGFVRPLTPPDALAVGRRCLRHDGTGGRARPSAAAPRALARATPGRRRRRRSLMALLNLPSYAPFDYASMNADVWPVVARLDDQLASLRGQGPVFVDLSTTTSFDDPYAGPLFVILQNHDVPFRVTGEPMIRQLGERRRFEGSARRRIWHIGGSRQPAPEALPADVERVALVLGIDDGELRELGAAPCRARRRPVERGPGRQGAGGGAGTSARPLHRRGLRRAHRSPAAEGDGVRHRRRKAERRRQMSRSTRPNVSTLPRASSFEPSTWRQDCNGTSRN